MVQPATGYLCIAVVGVSAVLSARQHPAPQTTFRTRVDVVHGEEWVSSSPTSRSTPLSRSAIQNSAASLATLSSQAQTPALESVLTAAGHYLEQYERDVTAVIAQEDYQQRVLSEARVRHLRSDMLIVAVEHAGWVELRDTFEVDGNRVRDRDERIAKLFMKPNPDAIQQARRIALEGARFNISPNMFTLNRTLNVPLTALRFVRGPNQDRSTFQLDRVEPSRIILKFREHGKPRLIASDDGSAATGSFTIEPTSGRVLESELQLVTRRVSGKFSVVYAEQPALKLWLPASMTESYTFGGTSAMLDGRATYSNFRMFRVETSTVIDK